MNLRGGRYEILRVIAAGGMAKVFLGRTLGAGGFERLVAVKAMHAHLAAEQDFVDMFLDEARLAARIHHPNVVATLDVQQDEEGVFLVMEYVDGPALGVILRELRKVGRLVPLDVALRIALDSLAGLHVAHELTGPEGEPLNLVHRDISPQNILVGADGIARITDFGVARAESRISSTKTGDVKGKVLYMAPEQIRRGALDRRTDVYAAGAVLWEILAGQRLIQGETDPERMMMIIGGAGRPIAERNPPVPPAIEAACLKAIHVDPAERHASAAAFAEALEAAAAASSVAIAQPRAVAAFVKDLGVHKSVTDLLSGSIKRPLTSAAPVSASRPIRPADGEPVSTSSTSSIGSIGSVGSTRAVAAEPAPPPRRSPVVLAAAVVAALAAALGGGVILGRSGAVAGGEAPSADKPAPSADKPAPSADKPAPPADNKPAPPADKPAPQVAATASADPPASASASASAAPAPAPAPTHAAPRPAAKAPGAPAPRPTNFRPKEL